MQNYHVYILKCSDGSYYIGFTSDDESRLVQHQQGIVDCYTFSKRPVELVFNETFKSKNDAFNRERQIKGWSRQKKEALINQDWELLSQLSKSKKY